MAAQPEARTGTCNFKWTNEYNMDHKNRGIAFIFNIENFKHLPPRPGTNYDCERLVKTFRHLGFKNENIRVCTDFSVSDIKNTISKYIDEDHSEDDCVAIAVLTHGNFTYLYGSDGKFYHYELWEPFTATNSPSLAGKPKLFFIQTCLGNKTDEGFEMQECGGDTIDSSSVVTYKIPCYADLLIFYATVPGFYSWRSESSGSCFVQYLCEALHELSGSEDIGTILTIVNLKVAVEYESNVWQDPKMNRKKQMPCIMSMLTKKMYFRSKRQDKIEAMDVS